MFQIRKIVLRGDGVQDAVVNFSAGANVLAGESDTGKSYLVQCLDFIMGAQKLKHLDQAVPYKRLYVEFENSQGESLTLARGLDGSHVTAYRYPIDKIQGTGEIISAVRKGLSRKADITSVLFPFAGISEAILRKNVRGQTQRLSIRTLAPLFLIDEVSIVKENSPVTGDSNYEDTPQKRTLSYLLTGIDDEGIIASEKDEVVKARLKAKLELVIELLEPLEKRFGPHIDAAPAEDFSKLDESIESLAAEIKHAGEAHEELQVKVQHQARLEMRADSQLLGINGLLTRYRLLDERYVSDLDRLDFIAEGSFYLDALQNVHCPLCDQTMPPHEHPHDEERLQPIRSAAIAEAEKIKAHRNDLASAITDIEQRKSAVEGEREEAAREVAFLRQSLREMLTPRLSALMEQYEKLVAARADKEALQLDKDRMESLRKLRDEIQDSVDKGKEPKQSWNGISPKALRGLCNQIEEVLKTWSWSDKPHVDFDEKDFDIVVDGQPRNSHGKGVRAILYSAFTIGLLRYCAAERMPHPGVVVIDSPLTSFKKKTAEKISGADGQVSQGVEDAFWASLVALSQDVQIIVIENKEPPVDVARLVHYEWFAGAEAKDGERAGFIPPP